MLLTSSDGARLGLRPTGHQLPAVPQLPPQAGGWDASGGVLFTGPDLGFSVALRTSTQDLLAAVRAWADDLAPFPRG